MKTVQTIAKAIGTAALVLAVSPVFSAGILEQILANPRIQALIGKPNEVSTFLGFCNNPSYQIANAQVCAEVTQTQMVLRLPFEMRTVMSNPTSAQSLRDLCLAAQATPQANSYLCAELIKADSNFANAVTLDRLNRTMPKAQERDTL
jgi:hypothetical protein